VYFKGERIVCTGADTIEKSSTPKYSSFQDFLSADKDINWCLHSLSITKEQDLVEAIKDGLAMAISDGSYKSCYGTAAWTIGDPDTASMLSAKVICPGTEDDHDAYRSELSGLYSIMMIIEKFCDFHEIKEGSIAIGCDGKSALETAFDSGTKLFRDVPSFDLVGAIMHLRRRS